MNQLSFKSDTGVDDLDALPMLISYVTKMVLTPFLLGLLLPLRWNYLKQER